MNKRNWVATLLLTGALMVLSSTASAKGNDKDSPVFAMVTDDKQPIYDRFVKSFEVQSRADFYEFSLYGQDDNTANVISQALAMKPTLFVAVGPKSARALAGKVGKTPLLITMVPSIMQKQGKAGNNIAGVMLERSPVSRLQVFQQLFPNAKKLGIAYDPKVSQARINAANDAARAMNLKLLTAPISNPSEVDKALQKLKGKIDVLVLLNDPSLLNLTTIDAAAEFSIVNQLPTIALSDQMVARGILLGVSVDYARLGTQAGQLANRIAFEGVKPGALGFVAPDGIQISLNLTTSKNFPAACDIKSRVLIYAADNNFDVEVFR